MNPISPSQRAGRNPMTRSRFAGMWQREIFRGALKTSSSRSRLGAPNLSVRHQRKAAKNTTPSRADSKSPSDAGKISV